jgi:hypothetical protein
MADQVAAQVDAGIADDPVIPEVVFGMRGSRTVKAFSEIREALAKALIRIGQRLKDALAQWRAGVGDHILNQIAQAQTHPVFPKVTLEAGATFLDEIIPV